jgi:hypothetical protein
MDDFVLPIGLAGIVGVAMFSGGGDMSGLTGGGMGAEIKALQTSLAAEQVISESRQQHLGERAELALQRYQQGCTVHVRHAAEQRPEHAAAGATTVEYMPVVAGDVARNPLTGGRYSAGVTLCDPWGSIGVVGSDGAVEDVAHYGGDVHQFIDSHFNNLWGGRRPQL